MEEKNNQAAIRSNHTSLTVKEQQKPFLAKIQEEYPKIKNENIQAIDGTINYLFALLNVQFKENEKDYRDAQTLVLSDFLIDRFKHLTLEEVKQAFKMYASKEFPDLKTFRILDCISLGEVLNAFVEYRNQQLHIYNQKKIADNQKLIDFNPSEEEKKKNRLSNLEMLFESLKSDKTDYSAFIYYDELKEKGKINPEDAFKLYDSEKKIYENELKEDVLKNSNKKFHLTDFQRESEKSKWHPVVVSRTKSAVVSKFLKQFETFYEFLKQFE